MGDKDDGLTLIGQTAQDQHQLAGLAAFQPRRWLVKNDQVGVLIERTQDLNALLIGNRQVSDHGAHVQRHFELIHNLLRLAQGCAVVHERADTGLPADGQIVQNRSVEHE